MAIVVVSGTNPGEGREGPSVDVFPVVNDGEGWLVELLAFDASRDGNIPIVQIPGRRRARAASARCAPTRPSRSSSPPTAPCSSWSTKAPTDSRETSGVGTNDDPYARYDPPGTSTPGEHRLVVIGVGDDGTIVHLGGSFTVQG